MLARLFRRAPRMCPWAACFFSGDPCGEIVERRGQFESLAASQRFFLGFGGIRGEAFAQFASLGLTSQGCDHECMGRDARRGRQPDDAFLKVFWQLQARGGHSDYAF